MTYRTYEIRWRNQYVSVTVAEERLGYRTRLRLLKDRPITVNSYRAESVRCQVVRPQKISHLRLTESDSLVEAAENCEHLEQLLDLGAFHQGRVPRKISALR